MKIMKKMIWNLQHFLSDMYSQRNIGKRKQYSLKSFTHDETLKQTIDFIQHVLHINGNFFWQLALVFSNSFKWQTLKYAELQLKTKTESLVCCCLNCSTSSCTHSHLLYFLLGIVLNILKPVWQFILKQLLML